MSRNGVGPHILYEQLSVCTKQKKKINAVGYCVCFFTYALLTAIVFLMKEFFLDPFSDIIKWKLRIPGRSSEIS